MHEREGVDIVITAFEEVRIDELLRDLRALDTYLGEQAAEVIEVLIEETKTAHMMRENTSGLIDFLVSARTERRKSWWARVVGCCGAPR